MKVIIQHIEMKIEIMIRHNAVDNDEKDGLLRPSSRENKRDERAQVKYLKLSFHG